MNWQPECNGDPNILEMSVSQDNDQRQQPLQSGSRLNLEDKLCVLTMAELEKWRESFRGAQNTVSEES